RDNTKIIGVVRDNKYTSVDEKPRPMAYYAGFQNVNAGETMLFEVRVNGEPLNLLLTIRRTVHDIDPNVPLVKPMTQRAQFEESCSPPSMVGPRRGFFRELAPRLVATRHMG